jgi:hypothetical protein
MLQADPRKPRQLSVREPDVFWRDGETGRTGLVVSARVCANPECPCRDIELVASRVGEWLVGVASKKGVAQYLARAATPGQQAPETVTWVLRADLDIDTGELRFAASTPPELRDETALGWLREEMDGALLDHLADKMLRGKYLRPRARMRVESYAPGGMVYFDEAYLTGRIDTYLIDGRRFEVADAYCLAPACTCKDMRLAVNEGNQRLGSIVAALDQPGWNYRFEGKPELARVWAAFVRRYPDPRPFRKRDKLMKEAGPDILASARPAPRVAEPSVGRNQPCPCGSGKKYKRCCLPKNAG